MCVMRTAESVVFTCCPPLPLGAIGVDAQVFHLHVDHNRVVDLRADEDAGEAGMPPLGRVERRDAHQPMHARFAAQQAVGKVAGDGEGRGLDPRLVAVLNLVDLGAEALPLGPAQIHAHQHLGPVLALRAARAGMHGDDGVQRIGLAREHRLRFQLLGELHQRGNLAFEVGLGRLAFLRQLEVGLDVVGAAEEFGVVGQQRLQPLALAHQRLHTRRICPHTGVGDLLFNDCQFTLQPGRVKDTPAAREPARAPGSIGIPDRRSSC